MRPVAAERAVRRGLLRTAASRVACALAVLATTVSPCLVGATGETSATPSTDRLGESRLFFSALERRAAGRGGGAPGAASTEPAADAPPRAGEPPGASPPAPRRPRVRPDVTFQALLRVGDRVQALVDGRPCRAVHGAPAAGAAPIPLRCVALPPGVRTLALDTSAGRLVVTPERGRRRRLAVGESLRP